MAWASCFSPDFQVNSVTGAAAGTTALADRRLTEATNGGPTFTADAIDTGRVAITMSSNAVAVNTAVSIVATTSRYAGGIFRFLTASFNSNAVIVSFLASTSTDNILLRCLNSTGELQYSFNNGSTYTGTGKILTASQVYRIETFVDWNTGTTHTFKLRVDAVEIGVYTGGASTVTQAAASFVRFGTSTGATNMTLHYADLATYNDPAQYATLNDWRVLGLEPTADGTHAVGSGAFQDAAAASITNGTTNAYTNVDDAPGVAPSGSDFVRQTVDDANAYLEFQLRSMPTGYDPPLLVNLAAALYPSTTGANLSGFHLNSGGNVSTEAPIDTSIAANTLEYRMHIYPTEPSTAAAWTAAMARAPLRARFGYTTLIPAQGGLGAIMAFVLTPAPVFSPAATASASAPIPTIALSVPAPAATANASAPTPTVAAASTVTAPIATATASAPVPTIALSITTPAATASASAPTPAVAITIAAPAATASASAPLPVIALSVTAPAATAVGSALLPSVALQVPAPASTASASSLTPDVTAGTDDQLVEPGVTLADAIGLIPELQLRIAIPTSTASALAPTPAIALRLTPAEATASASSPMPSTAIGDVTRSASDSGNGIETTSQILWPIILRI